MRKEGDENFENPDHCPVRIVIDKLNDKWTMLILFELAKVDKKRFNELNHSIGDISQKMLTQTLRYLEADGLVTRHYFAEIPPRVEYSLTQLGYSLIPHLEALTGWAAEHMDEILKNREIHAAAHV